MRACLHCGQPVSAGRGFYELTKQPGGAAAGQLYTLCSDPCLAAFVQGGEPEPETVTCPSCRQQHGGRDCDREPEQPEAEPGAAFRQWCDSRAGGTDDVTFLIRSRSLYALREAFQAGAGQ